MRGVFFLLFCLFSILSFGFSSRQQNKTEHKQEKKMNATEFVSFSMGITYTNLKTKGSTAYNLKALGRSTWLIPATFSAAIQRRFQLFQKYDAVKLAYGLRYRFMQTTGNYEEVFANGTQEKYQFNLKFSAIEFPLQLQYQFQINSFHFSAGLGAAFAIFLAKSDRLHYIETYNGNLKRDEMSGAIYLNRASGEGLMSGAFLSCSSLAVDYPLLKTKRVFIESTYQLYGNIANSTQVSLNPVFTDLHLGIRF